MVHELAREHDIEVTDIARNEFGEESFVLSGPDGATWQVIGRNEAEKPAVLEFKLVPDAN